MPEAVFAHAATARLACPLLHLLSRTRCPLTPPIPPRSAPSDTWPVQLNVLYSPVVIQWLWSFFNTISGAIGIGWGTYSPGTPPSSTAAPPSVAAALLPPCASRVLPCHTLACPLAGAATWPEALVWLFAMLVESIMFAVLTGYIFSYILAVSAVKSEARGGEGMLS